MTDRYVKFKKTCPNARFTFDDIKYFKEGQWETWEDAWIRMKMMVEMNKELDVRDYISNYYDGLSGPCQFDLDEECGGCFLELSPDQAYAFLEISIQLWLESSDANEEDFQETLEIESEIKSVISEPIFVSFSTNDILQEMNEKAAGAAPGTAWAPPTVALGAAHLPLGAAHLPPHHLGDTPTDEMPCFATLHDPDDIILEESQVEDDELMPIYDEDPLEDFEFESWPDPFKQTMAEDKTVAAEAEQAEFPSTKAGSGLQILFHSENLIENTCKFYFPLPVNNCLNKYGEAGNDLYVCNEILDYDKVLLDPCDHDKPLVEFDEHATFKSWKPGIIEWLVGTVEGHLNFKEGLSHAETFYRKETCFEDIFNCQEILFNENFFCENEFCMKNVSYDENKFRDKNW